MYVQSKSTVIFYYSQSGNSLDAAKIIANHIERNQASATESVKLISMSRAVYDHSYQFSDYDQVGFVFPLYFMGIPKTVETFLRNLQIDGKPYIFSVVTQALTHGNPFGQMEGFLSEKGLSLDFGAYVTYPDSYIRWMEGPEPEKLESALKVAYEQLTQITASIIEEQQSVETATTWTRMATAVVYPMWRGTLKGKGSKFRVSEACVKCGICKRTCPTQNIQMGTDQPQWSQKCEDCMACVQHCPTKAIYLNSATLKKRRYRNPNVELSELLL